MGSFEHLNVGDKVVIDGRYGHQTLTTVERLTKTQIITSKGKFRRSDGFSVGGDLWARELLREATPERIARIHEKEMRAGIIYKITRLDLHSLSTDKLQQIRDILDEE